MEQEFEDYWKKHRASLLVVAPKQLKTELKNNTRLNTVGDLVIYVTPFLVFGFLFNSNFFAQGWLNWLVPLLVFLLVYGVMEYIKPFLTGKRRYVDIEADIKQHFYQIYREKGLDTLEDIRG